MKTFSRMGCAIFALLLCGAASAQLAYTAKDAHLRAGPSRDYPVVAILPTGMPIDVQGCLNDYSWCDVIAGPGRGWLYAGNISYAYEGAYVPLREYGPEIGIGIVGFLLFDYWNTYYYARPWYRDRDDWIHRHGPGWPAGPPRPYRPGNPGGPPGGFPNHDRPGAGHPDHPGQGHPGAPSGRPPEHDRPGAAQPQRPAPGQGAPRMQGPRQERPEGQRPPMTQGPRGGEPPRGQPQHGPGEPGPQHRER